MKLDIHLADYDQVLVFEATLGRRRRAGRIRVASVKNRPPYWMLAYRQRVLVRRRLLAEFRGRARR